MICNAVSVRAAATGITGFAKSIACAAAAAVPAGTADQLVENERTAGIVTDIGGELIGAAKECRSAVAATASMAAATSAFSGNSGGTAAVVVAGAWVVVTFGIFATHLSQRPSPFLSRCSAQPQAHRIAVQRTRSAKTQSILFIISSF